MDSDTTSIGPETVRATPEPAYVVFDIEATGLHPWYGARVTCICARDSHGGSFEGVGKDEMELIGSFLEWLRERPASDHVLVTKNGKLFDVPFLLARLALEGDSADRGPLFLLDYEHVDLHEITDRWVSLADMARLLKCSPKSGTGKEAIDLWEEGRHAELAAYCMQDVRTTEEVYLRWTGLPDPP